MKTLALTSLLAAVALLTGTAAATAAAMGGNCAPATGMVFRASSIDNSQTNSATYATIPESIIGFTSATAGCVIVTFTTQMNSGSNRVMVRAYLDHAVGLPSEMQFNESISQTETRSATFIFPSVAAGAHTLRMQFATPDASNITIMRHSTIVHYMK
jgi:hypothetical protein